MIGVIHQIFSWTRKSQKSAMIPLGAPGSSGCSGGLAGAGGSDMGPAGATGSYCNQPVMGTAYSAWISPSAPSHARHAYRPGEAQAAASTESWTSGKK